MYVSLYFTVFLDITVSVLFLYELSLDFLSLFDCF